MWQDTLNGVFEALGSFFIFLHILRIIKHKKVRGVNPIAVLYFTAWGFWNCYYYPWLGQWHSFAGGSVIALMNLVWVALLVYYVRKEYHENISRPGRGFGELE